MAILCVSSVKRFVGAGSTRPLGSAVQRWAADRLQQLSTHKKDRSGGAVLLRVEPNYSAALWSMTMKETVSSSLSKMTVAVRAIPSAMASA